MKLLLLALLFVGTLSLSSPRAAKPPCSGLVGSASWYCVRNDRALSIRTWSFEDDSNRHSIEVCDFTGKRAGQALLLRPVWAKRWGFTQIQDTGLPLLAFTPSPTAFCKEWLVSAQAPGIEWEIDGRRVWQVWLNMVQGRS